MDSPLLKYSAKDYFFKAALCHFCIDMLNAKVSPPAHRPQGTGALSPVQPPLSPWRGGPSHPGPDSRLGRAPLALLAAFPP